MPVTGDVSFDFTNTANVNPYTNPELTVLNNDMQILDGGLKMTAITPIFKVVYSANAPGDDVTSKVETFNSLLGVSSSYGAGLFVLDGPDAGKGYCTRVNNGRFMLNRVDALDSYGVGMDFTAYTDPTITATATHELSINASGVLVAKYNGVTQVTRTVSEHLGSLSAGIQAEWGSGNPITVLSFAVNGVAVAPTINFVGGFDDEFSAGDTDVVINGTNFGSEAGPAKVTLSARGVTVDQPITTWGPRNITFNATQEQLPFGAATCIVTLSDGSTVSHDVTFLPASGFVYQSFSGALTDSTSLAYQAGAVENLDVIEVPAVVSGSSMAVNPVGTFVLTPAISGTATFERRIWKNATKAWEGGTVIVNNSAVQQVFHVTNIDLDDRIYDNQPMVEINGFGFGASEGTVTIGGIEQPITSWTDTKIVLTYVEVTAAPLGASILTVTKAI